MDKLLDVEPLPIGFACKKFVRIRVEMDADLPLKTGFIFPRVNESPTLISFKYEKLF